MTIFLFLAFVVTDEIGELRSQIQSLKKQNQQLKAQLELAAINGFYSPDAKTVVSPLQLLKALPQSLKLQRKVTTKNPLGQISSRPGK